MGSYTIKGEPYKCPKCRKELLMNPAKREEHIKNCKGTFWLRLRKRLSL